MKFLDIVTLFSDLFTIVGVIAAIVIYFCWKKDYKTQKAHEYAADLLKKMKYLHFEIELLRTPKFYHRTTLTQDIENHHIHQIREKILAKFVDIQVNLLAAATHLIKHKDLQSSFNDSVKKEIINKIHAAMYLFYSHMKDPNFNASDSDLFAIIFPMEIKIEQRTIKKSVLGTGVEIVDDEFNKIIEKNFELIYAKLKDNLA